MNILLMSKQNAIPSLELPLSIVEIDERREVFQTIVIELEAMEDKLRTLVEHGQNLAESQEKAVASTVIEKLESLKNEWSDVLILCNHQIGSLTHQRDIQVRFR